MTALEHLVAIVRGLEMPLDSRNHIDSLIEAAEQEQAAIVAALQRISEFDEYEPAGPAAATAREVLKRFQT